MCSLIVVTLSPTFCFYLNVHGDFEGLENHNAVTTTTLDNMELGGDDLLDELQLQRDLLVTWDQLEE